MSLRWRIFQKILFTCGLSDLKLEIVPGVVRFVEVLLVAWRVRKDRVRCDVNVVVKYPKSIICDKLKLEHVPHTHNDITYTNREIYIVNPKILEKGGVINYIIRIFN